MTENPERIILDSIGPPDDDEVDQDVIILEESESLEPDIESANDQIQDERP